MRHPPNRIKVILSLVYWKVNVASESSPFGAAGTTIERGERKRKNEATGWKQKELWEENEMGKNDPLAVVSQKAMCLLL
jgi:hypothetical protein